MKYQPPKFTNKELLKIFPEAKEIIPKKIKEWEAILKKDKRDLKDCLAFIYSQKLDDFSVWFLEQVARLFLMPSIIEADGHILRLKRMLSISRPSGEKLKRWQEKVETARSYPIYEIAKYRLSLNPSGDKFSSLCPFHEERHPSFVIYTNSNRFHCFSCSESGDVIKLTMHLYGIDFKEAVKMLND